MSWTSGIPWEKPSHFATSAISHAKEWYSTHSFGQYALAILAVVWIVHIVNQLVYTPLLMIAKIGSSHKILVNHQLFFTFSHGLEVWLHTVWNHTNSSPMHVPR